MTFKEAFRPLIDNKMTMKDKVMVCRHPSHQTHEDRSNLKVLVIKIDRRTLLALTVWRFDTVVLVNNLSIYGGEK